MEKIKSRNKYPEAIFPAFPGEITSSKKFSSLKITSRSLLKPPSYDFS